MATAASVKDGGTPILPGEPTFTFRAKDKHAPAVLAFYAALCAGERGIAIEMIREVCAYVDRPLREDASPEEHVEHVLASKQEFEGYQNSNPSLVKIPD